MVKNLYCIKDVKAGFDNSPFSRMNDELAKRDFYIALNQPGSLLQLAPSDFELWKIGTIDCDSGIINSDVQFVVSGVNYGNENK